MAQSNCIQLTIRLTLAYYIFTYILSLRKVNYIARNIDLTLK
jgi:hypothetical protein